MKPTVIIINGFPQSGKDTFCDFAREKYRTLNYSTVDTVKFIAKDMGWNGEKTSENRDMLSALKDFYTQWFDGPYREVVELIKDCITTNNSLYNACKYYNLVDFIFIHSREPKEIKRVVAFCDSVGVECYTFLIDREDVMDNYHNNHADSGVHGIIYNSYIMNNGTLDQFKENVFQYLDSILSGSLDYWIKYINDLDNIEEFEIEENV